MRDGEDCNRKRGGSESGSRELAGEFAAEIYDLTHVMVGVGDAVEDDGEAIGGGDSAAGVGSGPVVGRLFADD